MEKSAENNKKPVSINVEKGKVYSVCTCGNTTNNIFCDGSHWGSNSIPHVFQAEKSETLYLHQGNLLNTNEMRELGLLD